MKLRLSCLPLLAALLPVVAAGATGTEPLPASPGTATAAAPAAGARDGALGFSSAQIASVLLCSAESSFDAAALLARGMGRSKDEAITDIRSRGEASAATQARMVASVEAAYARDPAGNESEWLGSRFAACLSGRAVPVPPDRAMLCYSLTYYMTVRMMMVKNKPKEQAIATLVKPGASEQVRYLAELAWQRANEPDRQKATIDELREFLVCARPAPPPAGASSPTGG